MSVRVELWSERDCPVCGLRDAFDAPNRYDVCRYCAWMDDREALDTPERASLVNGRSLAEARARWPAVMLAKLRRVPLSTFDVQQRAEGIEFVVDGMPLRALYGQANPNREASLAMRTARSGRTALYVCALCGDPDETAVTADVTLLDARVVWSRIGLEAPDADGRGSVLRLFAGPFGFAFDAQAYHRVIEARRRAGESASRV